jgi:hypothetical protein
MIGFYIVEEKSDTIINFHEIINIDFHLKTLDWSGKRGSNSRPRPWQGRALPTELFPHR